MKFPELLQVVGAEPVFETALLLAGSVDPRDVRRQLVRWTASGRVIQLRRGLYSLAPPYRRVRPEPFLVANRLHRPSYVSCQSALAFHGLVPEAVPVVLSVTTRRPAELSTPLGEFRYRQIKRLLFRGYRQLELSANQPAFVATPEKALLDLVYLEPGGERRDYLEALRLQNLDQLDLDRLRREAADVPKLRRAVTEIERLVEAEREAYQTL